MPAKKPAAPAPDVEADAQTASTVAPLADLATAEDVAVDSEKDRPFELTASRVPVVRVLDNESRHAITITAAAFEAAAESKRYTRLSSPAIDSNGAPLGPKFQTAKGE